MWLSRRYSGRGESLAQARGSSDSLGGKLTDALWRMHEFYPHGGRLVNTGHWRGGQNSAPQERTKQATPLYSDSATNASLDGDFEGQAS